MKNHLKVVVSGGLGILVIVLSIACGYLLQSRIKVNDYISGQLLSNMAIVSRELGNFSEGDSEYVEHKVDLCMEYLSLYDQANTGTKTGNLDSLLLDTRTLVNRLRTSPNEDDKVYMRELLRRIQPYIAQFVCAEGESEKETKQAMWQKKLQQFNDYYDRSGTDYTDIHLAIIDLN